MDIDYFKSINDTNGHKAGDNALKIFGALIQTAIRKPDFCARIGGEEFAVITSARDKVGDIGERIRGTVESTPFKIKEDKSINITCSFGWAVFPEHGATQESLFEAADKALYKAKENGRNQGCKPG